ncbi:hypothetical protein BD769DRAFT_1394918 [Suillus cothurnatus]|nr:hypothetical protein BD769DRAFT_1394918 [Suillus cothurnatus]
MFNAQRPEDYTLPRNSIVPLPALMEEIFPFIEQAQQDLKDHTQHSQLTTDIALHQFLSVLLWFRLVLLQDAALLYTKHPKIPVFCFKPFNTQCFQDYAHEAIQVVMQAEDLKGLVTSMTLDQQAQHAENEALHAETGPSLPHTTVPNFTINISGTSATNSSTSTSVPTVSRPTNFTLPSFGADQPLAIDTLSSDPHSEKWAALLTKYGWDKLDAHKWEWKSGDWLPRYCYQPVEVITDIWTDHLSTRELKDQWGAKWWHNEGGLKTEAARRSKVVSLVEQLSARPNWNVSLALRFLVKNYENTSAFVGKVCWAVHTECITPSAVGMLGNTYVYITLSLGHTTQTISYGVYNPFPGPYHPDYLSQNLALSSAAGLAGQVTTSCKHNTDNFGDYINNCNSWSPIINFIDDQHKAYMCQMFRLYSGSCLFTICLTCSTFIT